MSEDTPEYRTAPPSADALAHAYRDGYESACRDSATGAPSGTKVAVIAAILGMLVGVAGVLFSGTMASSELRIASALESIAKDCKR